MFVWTIRSPCHSLARSRAHETQERGKTRSHTRASTLSLVRSSSSSSIARGRWSRRARVCARECNNAQQHRCCWPCVKSAVESVYSDLLVGRVLHQRQNLRVKDISGCYTNREKKTRLYIAADATKGAKRDPDFQLAESDWRCVLCQSDAGTPLR